MSGLEHTPNRSFNRHRRTDSVDSLSGLNLNTNPATAWIHSYGFWGFYIFVIVIFRVVLWMLYPLDPAFGWTVTCLGHAFVSFTFLHMIKGAPIGDITIRGKYDNLTFWEQIDCEYHGTMSRKMFSTIPIILLAITMNWVRDDWAQLVWVLGATALCVVPKMPFMHRRRIGSGVYTVPDSPRSPH